MATKKPLVKRSAIQRSNSVVVDPSALTLTLAIVFAALCILFALACYRDYYLQVTG